MYDELRKLTDQERASKELITLSRDFYKRLAEYFKELQEKKKLLDRSSIQYRLLEEELKRARFMARELISTRLRKILQKVCEGGTVPTVCLTEEEFVIYDLLVSARPISESIISRILHGFSGDIGEMIRKGKVSVRFLEDVPAFLGTDSKVYGPYKKGDVASIPVRNADSLIRSGKARIIEL